MILCPGSPIELWRNAGELFSAFRAAAAEFGARPAAVRLLLPLNIYPIDNRAQAGGDIRNVSDSASYPRGDKRLRPRCWVLPPSHSIAKAAANAAQSQNW